MQINNQLAKEINLLHWFVGLFLILLFTGFSTWLVIVKIPEIVQAFALLHLYSGVGTGAIFVIYCLKHFKRTIGFRRFIAIAIGSLVALLFCALLISGAILGYYGVVKRLSWLFVFHQWLAVAFLVSFIVHLAHHYLTFPKRRLNISPVKFSTISARIMKYVSLSLVGSFCFVFVIVIANRMLINPIEPLELHNNYEYSYGKDPFKPSLTTTESASFIDEHSISGSEKCISCHQTIGEQWLMSAHRHAANDPTYVRNVNLLTSKRGISATRYCEGCHAPIALLTGKLTKGGDHGGVKNTVANNEGISCMSCHGINRLTSEEGVASYNFKPRTAYLFENAKQWPFIYLRQQVIKLKPTRHTQELLPEIQKTSQYCGACHTQFMDKSMNNWGWVKMQDELAAWSQSKFNTPKDSRFSHEKSKSCQDCHMPMMAGTDIAADSDGKIKSHFFVGANAMLAKHFGHTKLVELTKNNLQQDKISITIDPPQNHSSIQSDLYLSPNLRARNKFPVALYRGSQNKIMLLVSNYGVGHNFPGGTIDLNEAWIELKVYDGNQKLIKSSGHLSKNGHIENTATVYKEVAIDRHGQEVWRHDLFNMVGRSYINIIPAGETDTVEYNLNIPDWAVSPINIQATLKFRKLNQRYLNWVNLQQNIKFNPIIDIARDSIHVRLLKKTEGTSKL